MQPALVPPEALDTSTFIGLATQTWLWLGSALLFLGCLAIFFYGERRTEDEEDHLMVHGLVCAIAGTLYFAMASGVADATLATGRNFDFGRYVDWSLTTPLLLYGLALTAMHGRIFRKGVLIPLIGFDILMIATGLIAGFLPNEETGLKFAAWVLGDVFFLAVLYLIWTTLRREAETRGEVLADVFRRNATMLTVLWFIYPIVFIFGHNGLGTWSSATTAGLIVFLDTTAKAVYGLVATYGTKQIIEAECAGRVNRVENSALIPEHADTGRGRRPVGEAVPAE